MPHHEKIALTGVIEHVFAHRFTLQAEGQPYLADLGPKGAEAFALSPGLEVELEGERRPSEIKVLRIAQKGGQPVAVAHAKPHHAHGPRHHNGEGREGETRRVLSAVKKAGWQTDGVLKHHPKHIEVLACRDAGPWMELHVDFSGGIYKEKPAEKGKWSLG